MLIRVMYHDDKYDFVKPHLLDRLLEAGKVSVFRRRSGWVFVGIDPIRRKKTNSSSDGEERRQSEDERFRRE